MNATTDTFAADSARVDPYAAIYAQLHHTVLQLVEAALERARRDEPSRAALPAPVVPVLLAAAEPAAPAADLNTLLSAREREVLQRIAAGDSNKMVARALGLSPHTVKRHVANILDKLGVRTRGQAAAWLRTPH